MIRSLFILSVATVIAGCGFSKPETQTSGPSLSDIQVSPADWTAVETASQGIRGKVSTVSEEKRRLIREKFKLPTIRELTVPGPAHFALYGMTGFSELEGTAFIHPKLYVNSSTDRGTILGFRSAGESGLVTLSVPVALVNGLSESIPLVSGALSGTSAAASLPDTYRLSNSAKLAELLGRKLQTLPTCPKGFRIVYGKRQYYTESPFRSGMSCPTNQFFRIQFTAPEREMNAMLEAAAMRDDAVQVIADFDFSFEFPTRRSEVAIPLGNLFSEVSEVLSKAESFGVTATGRPIVSVQTAEQAFTAALKKQVEKAGFTFAASSELPATTALALHQLFDRPPRCSTEEACLSLKDRPAPGLELQYSWLENESLGSILRSESRTALGAVANGSKFLARHESTLLPNDGYLPLGANTTVYPGAWLKLDVDQILELTTARTKTASDGTVVVQSEVVDVLATTPIDKRVVCTEGAATACKQYQTKKVPSRNKDGTPRHRPSTPCTKAEEGRNGCACSKNAQGQEECAIPGDSLFEEVFETECDPSDLISYCPYYREEEQVIDYDVEYECKDIVYEDHANFLCISGCHTFHRLECKEKSRKPVKAVRRVLNCVEDEQERLKTLALLGEKNLPAPKASALRIQECRRPRYVCKEWDTKCTRYSLNESFLILHEEPAPKWRPFALERGEFPPRFEEEVFLKFTSPSGRVSTDCRLSKFQRELRGQAMFIKIPSEKNEDSPCDIPIWDEKNAKPGRHPKVFVRNGIHFPQERLCGKTEYSFLTKNVPLSDSASTLPLKLNVESVAHAGPVEGSCLAKNAKRRGNDLWYLDEPPIQFHGRVSVLGRMLESIVSPGAGR